MLVENRSVIRIRKKRGSWGDQSTFRSLEIHSYRAIKFISVRSFWGNLSLLEITRASVLFSPKILDAV